VDNNPLKYIDPTGHGVDTIIFDNFLDRINRDKTGELNIWIGDAHGFPDGKKLIATLAKRIDACVAVAFLLGLGFVFTCNDGSATIGVVVFITEGLGLVQRVQLLT
jgi:hypothetical protein